MEFLLSNILGHKDVLSKLITKLCEPLEETVIATLTLETEIKSIFYNTILELQVTIKDIRNKAKIDKYIAEKKKEIIDPQFKKIDSKKMFSISDRILIYG